MANRRNSPTKVPAAGLGERRPENRDRETADDSGAQPANRVPQPDHSEREGGGDQDIDTAGLVPGNMATDNGEPDVK